MTVWSYSVSWSKAKLALDCPLSLQYTIDRKPFLDSGRNYYQNLGKVVQFIFEQYFNQKVNQRAEGRTEKVIEAVTEKILKSGYFKNLNTNFGGNVPTEDEFKNTVRTMVLNGFRALSKVGMLDKPLRSEHKWNSVFRGHRIFGVIDFTYIWGKFGVLFDGKGHARKNADPRQVIYYGLGMAASGIHLQQPSGFIYWGHDPAFEPIDVSPAALKEFADGEFTIIKKTFDELKKGVSGEMEATPSPATCNFCSWRNTCKYSPYFRKELEGPQQDEMVNLI